VRWSPQAENIFGWGTDEVLGMQLTDNVLLHEDDRAASSSLIERLSSGDEPRATGLTRNHRKDGETIWCEWYHSALLDDQGRIVSILSFVQDVSSRIQAEERLQYLATRDALTGLPNRLLLNERLAQAIAQARRSGRRVGVLFIDLDRFKNVNDTLGHRIGDELLKRVSQALSNALRETDLLARLGGDEFMVVVEDFDDPAMLGRVAQKLLDAVAHPFRIEGHDIYVTSSIGISVYPDDSDDPEELLKHADVAMYRSKELGRNTFQYLDADLAQRRAQQHTLDWRLLAAMGYQESKWDPQAVSFTGVRGLMQLTEDTASRMRAGDRSDPRSSIFGAAKYLSLLLREMPRRIPEPDRTWFAVAAYNVGLGHLEDARVLAQQAGRNPDRWEDVREFLPLLSQERWYTRTKRGYARGWEPVRYVDNVQAYLNILQVAGTSTAAGGAPPEPELASDDSRGR
jgi:diguanylate cyclase (GGDEF)-like protein/PAS domain S-box-containing protein